MTTDPNNAGPTRQQQDPLGFTEPWVEFADGTIDQLAAMREILDVANSVPRPASSTQRTDSCAS